MRGRIARSAIAAMIVAGPVLVAIAISMVVILVSGGPPIAAMRALLQGAFGGKVAFARTFSYLLPLSLVGLAWTVSFTCRRINVGYEGQIVMGGIGAFLVGASLPGLAGPVHVLLASLIGAAAGAAYVGIAVWLWAKRGVNEIISTLLLNFVAIQFLGWLVRGPLGDPESVFPVSRPVLPTAQWPAIIPNTALTWSIAVVPFALIAGGFLLRRTVLGYTMRVTGSNPDVAQHMGIPTVRTNVIALLISGAVAGLAGACLILGGEPPRLADGFSAGFGFDGIAVALVARNSIWGVLPAALLFAVLRSGGGLMESSTGVSLEVVLIMQGLVIILVSSTSFLLHRVHSPSLGEPSIPVEVSEQQPQRP